MSVQYVNAPLSASAGPQFAAESVGTGWAPWTYLVFGPQGGGSYTGVDVASGKGLPVQPSAAATWTVVGDTVQVVSTPTISTSAYVSGYVVGGLITISGAARINGGVVTVQDLLIIDEANQRAPLTLLFFDSPPAGTYTDHAACPTLGEDADKVIGQVNVAASDYTTTGGAAIAHKQNLSFVLPNNNNDTSLRLVMVTTGTPTYTAADDLMIKFKLYQD